MKQRPARMARGLLLVVALQAGAALAAATATEAGWQAYRRGDYAAALNIYEQAAAAALLRYEGRDVGWCSCSVENADAHAGHTETSVLLHISPNDVWVDQCLPGNMEPLARLMPQMRQGGVAAVSERGTPIPLS